MPTLDSAIVYPGTVLFEGTMLSEGRGTTRPFELVGAPWIDAERFARDMNAPAASGCVLPAGGVRTDVSEAREAGLRRLPDSRAPIATAFRPVMTGVALIDMFRRAATRTRFAWRQPPYEYEKEKLPFDILAGSDTLRRQIEARR